MNRDTRIGLVGAAAFVALFLLIGAVFGQTPPTVTEVESLKLENIQLKASAIQGQMKDLQAQMKDLQNQYQELTDAIAKEHPGYMWNGQALVASVAAGAKGMATPPNAKKEAPSPEKAK